MHPIRLPFLHPAGLCWSLHVGAMVLSGVATLAYASQAHGQEVPELGTLFYSVPERQAIVRARKGAQTAQQGADAPILTTTQLSGIVRRGERRGTVWVNGQPHAEGSAQAGQLKSRDTTVLDGHPLRVGESVDKLTGARSDVVAPGAVRAQGKP